MMKCIRAAISATASSTLLPLSSFERSSATTWLRRSSSGEDSSSESGVGGFGLSDMLAPDFEEAH
jgi:hypothetical protein